MYLLLKPLNYICKKFHNIKLNSLTTKMLNFWENEFDQHINEHIEFLKENSENQTIYCSQFSKILEKMDIFQTEDQENAEDHMKMNLRIIKLKMIKKMIRG